MGGFTIHANLPGRLIQGSNDHDYGPLTMVVESILVPGRLIKMHEHRNDEIISWVPAGVMRHNDRTVGELVTDSDHLNVSTGGWRSRTRRTASGSWMVLVRPTCRLNWN
jgi:redox-sensitive bicupin YhaK (pirin superfamily)